MGSRGKAAQGHVTDHAGTQLAHGTPPSENWDGGDSRRANATQAERENLLPREAVRCPTYRASGLVQHLSGPRDLRGPDATARSGPQRKEWHPAAGLVPSGFS